jgi:hypothetical protein
MIDLGIHEIVRRARPACSAKALGGGGIELGYFARRRRVRSAAAARSGDRKPVQDGYEPRITARRPQAVPGTSAEAVSFVAEAGFAPTSSRIT